MIMNLVQVDLAKAFLNLMT